MTLPYNGVSEQNDKLKFGNAVGRGEKRQKWSNKKIFELFFQKLHIFMQLWGHLAVWVRGGFV